MSKIMVPRHRIPKVSALCPKCRQGSKIVAANAYADGYHRRHMCLSAGCGHLFYTLAPYDGGEVKQSPLPFKDRPLSEAEIDMRLGWWTETEASKAMTSAMKTLAGVDVTTRGNAPVDEFIQRVATAIEKEESERTTTETYIVSVINALKTKVAQFDRTQGLRND